jgi:hypothetical protein
MDTSTIDKAYNEGLQFFTKEALTYIADMLDEAARMVTALNGKKITGWIEFWIPDIKRKLVSVFVEFGEE